jgi:hypothetical protein
VKTLAIAVLATAALLPAATVVHAEPPAGCDPIVEATTATETGCVPAEQEEAGESTNGEAGPWEYEEMGPAEFEELQRDLEEAPSTGAAQPAQGAQVIAHTTAPPKTAACRRASDATIRADDRRIRRLRGKRRRSAERRLERALCR